MTRSINMADSKLLVFVHGWSVRNTNTYGRLPDRLKTEAAAAGIEIDVENIYLSKYISFRDEVRVEDIARGMEAAFSGEPGIQAALATGRKIVVITHSTGGPVAREWLFRFYVKQKRPSPMSHLIMLAPANFGSALAQLGKSKVSRLKSWTEGVEPGQGVLDWLELGSDESWQLNESWIRQTPRWSAQGDVFQFVLTGQQIDRSLYDHVNNYTGETGSDGVVRVAAANLNARYVKCVQEIDPAEAENGNWRATQFRQSVNKVAPRTAMAVLPKSAHSGATKGILRSVKMTGDHPTVSAILKCLTVDDASDYTNVVNDFDRLTKQTQEDERIEKEERFFFSDREFTHPLTTQLIVRITDDAGHPLEDFDFLLTGWDTNARKAAHRVPNPNLLPSGFLIDRQRNQVQKNTLTLYLNQELISNSANLGVAILPRPEPAPRAKRADDFFVHYLRGLIGTDSKTIATFLQPNSTLMLDIVMLRVVREGVFRLTKDTKGRDFTNTAPDNPIT